MKLNGHRRRSAFPWVECLPSSTILLPLFLYLCSSASTATDSDHLALLSFKLLISEDPLGALDSWNHNASLSFCQWRGVTCGDQGRVTALELESLGLTGEISPSISNLTFLQRLHLFDNLFHGSIPPELGLLTHLQHLNLSFNPLGGTIPDSLFQNCSRLQNLSLSYNGLHGPIPRRLGRCSQLQRIGMVDNGLQGEVPSELGSLLNLRVLSLGNNSFTGSIPWEIGNLAALNRLSLNDNQFTGTIPASMQSLTSLSFLDMSNNRLTGLIPPNISRCSQLQFLDLGNNTLHGEVPGDLGSLSELRVLSLWGNHLTGSIPFELRNLVNLRDIALFTNDLRGSVPLEMGNMISLRRIFLHDNHLSGTIPPQIGKLRNLTLLSLTDNNFSGSIPSEIGNLTNLIELYLDANQLSGRIPREIGNLVNLTLLVLILNNLVGTVPAAIGNLTSLTYLGLAFNNLQGVIPPSVWNLSSLLTLEIQSNHFNGSLPPDIGFTLPQIQELHINGNQFSGPLPMSLSNATGLMNIQLYENNFTGTIPRGYGSLQSIYHFDVSYNQLEARSAADWGFLDDLANCSSLQYLQLTGNRLGGFLPQPMANFSVTLEWFEINDNYIAGSIPVELGNFGSLTSIRLNSNMFNGSIPTILGNLPRLLILDLSSNYLSGEIPATFGRLTQLLELQLHSNQLQGPIPPSLGDCPLQLLDLSHNKLIGTVPKEIMPIPTLTKFVNFSHNSLVGSLPFEVGKMKNLGAFDISSNGLSGTIPSSLGDCQQLEYLNMSGNYFEGSIPSSLSMLKGLDSLDLSRNNLSGHIPEFLQNFTALSYLNLSFNNFNGEVPEDGIFRNLNAFSLLGNGKLCGGVPSLKLPPCPMQSSTKKHVSHKLLVAISVASGIICLAMLLSLFGIVYRIYKSNKEPHATDCMKDPHLKVSYAELLRATNDFSIENLIGMGSFGSVYKGNLNHIGYKVVAVKVLNLQQKGASRSFIVECETLRNIRHRNLVKVLTACASTDFRGNDFKALVYEFMPSGNLDKWLHPEAHEQGHVLQRLNFLQRLDILIDVASALDYLHHHGAEPIVHCDIKPSNVLLDDNMVAHLGDFGLARFLNRVPIEALERSFSSTVLKGSIGYVAPEYGAANKVSTAGDAYSYGILALEMLTGKRPTGETFKDGLSLPQYVEEALSRWAAEILDPYIMMLEEKHGANDFSCDMENFLHEVIECATLTLRIGIKCAKETPQDRMQIGDAIPELVAIRSTYLEHKMKMEKLRQVNSEVRILL